MSGKQAKRIRASVYGEYSSRERSYERDPRTGTIRCTGLRRAYQQKKKEHRNFLDVLSAAKDRLIAAIEEAKKVAA